MKHTKIVATVSDLQCDVKFLTQLHEAGMNVTRLNTAHMSEEGAASLIKNVRAVSDKIALLVDTKGPEIRTMEVEEPIEVATGDLVEVSGISRKSTEGRPTLRVAYDKFHTEISVGGKVLIDDGELGMTVTEKKDDYVICTVDNPGKIKNRKSINTPGFTVNLPSVSEKDMRFIKFAAKNNIDFIAHSFVRNAEDVLKVQELLDKEKSPIKIIAKIENIDGVNNIDEILDHAYGIMVARGDLGIEVPAEKIPGIQRMLIKKAVQRKKPVIIATQMLHTMIENPRPTRAEVSDVANAIYSRADAIMLSGETAYGKYPVEAVSTMNRIANEIENSKDKRNDIAIPPVESDIPTYLSEAAINASKELNTEAIVTNTMTGRTARYLAAFRGDQYVYAQCYDHETARLLALSYGVYADVIEPKKNRFKMIKSSLDGLVEKKVLSEDSLIVYVGGSFGIGGGSSFMEIATVEKLTDKAE